MNVLTIALYFHKLIDKKNPEICNLFFAFFSNVFFYNIVSIDLIIKKHNSFIDDCHMKEKGKKPECNNHSG